MALTAEQKAFRSTLLGGSDANTIMGGNPDRIMKLWRVKTGQEEDEDLSDNLNVQMGVFTEPFNIQWFEKNTGRKVTDNGKQLLSRSHLYLGCTLDGLTDDGATVFEAKHVSAFAKEEEILDTYFPQLTHNMLVCGVERAVLSVFFGNHKWEKFEVTLDAIYADILVDAESKFWKCVLDKVPPLAVKTKSPLPAIRSVDFTGNNEWANLAHQLNTNATGKKLYDSALSQLKAMVEDDVVEASGYGVGFKRDKRGALRLKGE